MVYVTNGPTSKPVIVMHRNVIKSPAHFMGGLFLKSPACFLRVTLPHHLTALKARVIVSKIPAKISALFCLGFLSPYVVH